MHLAKNSNKIHIERVYDAPVRAVWDAWTDPEQVGKWWGPRGFSITTHSKDLRAGGSWRYTMHGPDGTDYPNVTKYYVVEPYQKLEYDHGGSDDRPPLFRVTVTFAEAAGKTTMRLTFALASAQAAAETAKFIRQAGGNATWDRLAEHLEETATGRRRFVINRTLAAPASIVFRMWTSPEHLAQWLPPPGTTMRFVRSPIAAGKSTHFVIESAQGSAPMHVKALYLEIEPDRRIVYTQQFVDEREQVVSPPDAGTWPPTLLTTVTFAEEASDRTRVTVTMEPHGEVTEAEIDAFARERSGMTLGWTASLDALEAMVGELGRNSDNAKAER